MTKYQKRHRIIATFFLLIFFPTLLPNNLFASSNGPVAPEATSFEPVDATDMVNLASGDLSYVLPLLDVPSSEGEYPLSLSYHAGIAIDQDASWVGLGWSLNPGTINRSVSGFPDDWKQENVSSIVYDSGGEIAAHNFGVGVGWGNGNYSAGLYGSYSENKAFGGQNSYNFDGGSYVGVGNVQTRIGSDGIGLGVTSNYNFTVGTQSAGGNFSVGINHSFKTGGTSLSVSANAKMKSTGSSLETTSNGSIGISSVNNTGSNRGSHGSSYSAFGVGDTFSLNINIYMFNLNYSFNKIRYSYFDKKSYSGVGTLYAENITTVKNNSLFSHYEGFDTYTANYDQTDKALLGNNIVLPAYDFYSVNAQGLSGDISPKIFEYGTLTPKRLAVNIEGKKFNNDYLNKDSFTRRLDNDNIHFYFNNTCESYLNIDSDLWGNTPTSLNSYLDIVSINSPSSSITSSLTVDGINYNGYNSTKNRKKAASYIETYTNQQIISNQNLIYDVSNFNRNISSIPKDGIGAFKITSPDGKTYHYSLPVYQKEKFARFAKYDEDINNKFYEEYQTAPYATHWLLTAITGSDFVDDGDGKISDKDLGYWVTFDYGKWSDGYTWRTPRGGDYKTTPTSKTYEWGVKEIYYLNAVKTRTHTALFIKSEREDGKSISDGMDKEFESFGVTAKISALSIKDNNYHIRGLSFDSPAMDVYTVAGSYALHKVKMQYNKAEHKLLKLDKIIIVKNKDIPSNFGYSNPNQESSKITSTINIQEYLNIIRSDNSSIWKKDYTPIYNSSWSGEYYSNILDNKDINYYYPNIQNYSNRIIDFNYNYNLAKETPNTNVSTYGRLSLAKVTYKGKNGVQVLPPYTFEYENPNKVYNINNSDDWGYNKEVAASWNLNKIIHPNGANIFIKYEEDDYYSEAVNYETRFKNELKFTFSQYLDKLRIVVENIDPNNINKINFSSFYNINQQAKVNIWACLKHEYNDGGCKSRDGNINIDDENVDVVAVSNTSVAFETTLSNHTSNQNGGLDWLCGVPYTYEMDRLQAKERNECPDLTGGCSSRTAHTLYYSINSNKISTDQNGGGLRVKQITVNADGKNYNTNYFYNQDGYGENKEDSNYKSSGITSYSPSKYEKNIKYMAELPPPGVIYNTVRVVTDQDINKYYFKTFTPEIESNGEYSMGDILHIKKSQNQDKIPITVPGFSNSTISKYKYNIQNNFSMIGTLLKHEKFNKTKHLLRKTENNYKPITEISQGLIKETFNSYKNTWNYNSDINQSAGTFDLNVSSKTTYPSVIKSIKNYESGYINTTTYDKYDFLTGQILETTTISSDGQSYKTKVIPAYIKYPEMGSKADNINNKNMLSQEAVNYSYIFDKNDPAKPWKETGVGITTWSNIWEYRDIAGTSVNVPASSPSAQKIWRKHKTYVWNGIKDADGIFTNYDAVNGSKDDNFDWAIGVGQPSQWKQISEVTLYDHFSAPLEMKDINGNYASSKMGDDDTKVMVSGNAGYNEMFFAGGENEKGLSGTNWLEPGISSTGENVMWNTLNPYPHTGIKTIKVTPATQFGVTMKSNQHRTGKYKVSVWIPTWNNSQATLKINGNITAFTESQTAGGWILKTAYLYLEKEQNYSIAFTSSSGNVYYDDLMVRPVSSSITGYVYNEWDELTAIIGNNGLATKFTYDAASRLMITETEVVDDPANGVSGGFKRTRINILNNKYL